MLILLHWANCGTVKREKKKISHTLLSVQELAVELFSRENHGTETVDGPENWVIRMSQMIRSVSANAADAVTFKQYHQVRPLWTDITGKKFAGA